MQGTSKELVMGRPRTSDAWLPPHVVRRHGAYHFVDPVTGQWKRLSDDDDVPRMYRVLGELMAGHTGSVAQLLDLYKARTMPKKAVSTRMTVWNTSLKYTGHGDELRPTQIRRSQRTDHAVRSTAYGVTRSHDRQGLYRLRRRPTHRTAVRRRCVGCRLRRHEVTMNIIDMLRAAWNDGYSRACNYDEPMAEDLEMSAAATDREPDIQRILATSLDARSLDVVVVEDPDPAALSTALNTLEAAALSGTKLHSDDVLRLRATVDRLTQHRT